MKILVTGSINGNLRSFYEKVSKISTVTGQFDLILCVGEFLGEGKTDFEAYRDGRLICHVPTFFIGPVRDSSAHLYPEGNGSSICPNLLYLGHRGVLTTEDGLRIVYMSGMENAQNKQCQLHPSDIDILDIDLVKTGTSTGADILLTSAIPAGVDKLHASPGLMFETTRYSNLIAQLATKLKPRYHFCNGGHVHFEAPPYRNHVVLHEIESNSTRLISLPDATSQQDQMGLYAFEIIPTRLLSRTVQNGIPTLDCPYLTRLHPTVYPTSAVSISVTTATALANHHHHQHQHHHQEKLQNFFFEQQQREPMLGITRPANTDVGASSCWFCLSDSQSSHLVISSGEKVYLALARGGLTEDHVMIVPWGHIRSLRDCPSDTIKEIDMYKSALTRLYAATNQVCVFFERFLKTVHMQIQCVPIPVDKADKVAPLFAGYMASLAISYREVDLNTPISELATVGEPYFLVDAPTNKKVFCTIYDSGFHLQFGRIVLASPDILNISSKGYNWKSCIKSPQEETVMVERIRTAFEPYNPFAGNNNIDNYNNDADDANQNDDVSATAPSTSPNT